VRKAGTFITGASGEIGHGLIERLANRGDGAIISLDLQPLSGEVAGLVDQHFVGSILDTSLLERVLAHYDVDRVFHLAALLSTRSEFTPAAAHEVNVEGTLRLLEFAQKEGESHGRPVVLLYPSSIAAYGMPDVETKERADSVREDDWNVPTTMYGCNKLISAVTLPAGGTSDYAPDMLHAAAKGKPYACFVRPDTRIPFMAMPDAVEALLQLAEAPAASLSRRVYNVAAFNPSAEEIRGLVAEAFPDSRISFAPDEKRQRIVDSWPQNVDSSAARADWGFAPDHELERAFSEYLVPTIRGRYR